MKKRCSKTLKDLGRQARARLQEEREKRPEIVRLEEAPPTNRKRKTTTKGSLVAVKKKPKRQPSKQPRVQQSLVQDKHVDRWMPSTEALPSTKDLKSRWVQLHGLPVGTIPLQIRRFFSGLNPEHIYLLPTDTSQRLSHLLDASTEEPPRKPGGVSRYETLRVFVQFDSAPTASLAVNRCGEVMPLLPREGEEDAVMSGAAVAVTAVTKAMVSYFSQHMAMEAVSGIPLHESIEQIEKQLDPRIPAILWKAAEEHFGNQTDVKQIPYKTEEYEKLASYQNTLLRTYRELVSIDTMDPTVVASDPLTGLTAGAAACLQAEVKSVEQRLLQARRWKSLFGSVSKVLEQLEV